MRLRELLKWAIFESANWEAVLEDVAEAFRSASELAEKAGHAKGRDFYQHISTELFRLRNQIREIERKL